MTIVTTVTMPKLRSYNADGTLCGCFVYTLICQDENSPLYIKIGISVDPIARFRELRSGNPVPAIALAWISFGSRELAFKVEKELQIGVHRWHTLLEWFRVPPDEFDEFKAATREILNKFESKGRPPIRWQHANTEHLINYGNSARSFYCKILRRRGRAYADFATAARG